MATDYCTLPALKYAVGITSDRHDNDLDRAIGAASRAIDNLTGRYFYQDTTVQTRYYQADPADLGWLPVDDISTATGLVVKTDDDVDGTFENTWTANDLTGSYGYRLQPLNAASAPVAPWTALESIAGIWPSTPRTIEVTAKFGWANVPDPIAQAALLQVIRLWKRKDAPFGVMGSPETGVVQIARLDPDVAALVRPYRRMNA